MYCELESELELQTTNIEYRSAIVAVCKLPIAVWKVAPDSLNY
jgi:hypothetical protein